MKIPEGRKLVITPLREENDSTSRLFVELYRIKTNGKPQRLDYLTENTFSLTYNNEDQDTLLLLLQTGLNDQLAVSLSLTTLPSLAFPVASHSMSDVISVWEPIAMVACDRMKELISERNEERRWSLPKTGLLRKPARIIWAVKLYFCPRWEAPTRFIMPTSTASWCLPEHEF
jgi:hypothetical protein